MPEQAARKARFRKVVGMFLDGHADRFDEDAPMRRYAHVYKGSLTVCVTDADEADHEELDALYEPVGFKYVGTIDLDDGELMESSGVTAIGRAA